MLWCAQKSWERKGTQELFRRMKRHVGCQYMCSRAMRDSSIYACSCRSDIQRASACNHPSLGLHSPGWNTRLTGFGIVAMS